MAVTLRLKQHLHIIKLQCLPSKISSWVFELWNKRHNEDYTSALWASQAGHEMKSFPVISFWRDSWQSWIARLNPQITASIASISTGGPTWLHNICFCIRSSRTPSCLYLQPHPWHWEQTVPSLNVFIRESLSVSALHATILHSSTDTKKIIAHLL